MSSSKLKLFSILGLASGWVVACVHPTEPEGSSLTDAYFEVADPNSSTGYTRVASVDQNDPRKVRLVVEGTGFLKDEKQKGFQSADEGSWIFLDGQELSTSFVSSNQVSARVPIGLLAKAGTFPVHVRTKHEAPAGPSKTEYTQDGSVIIDPVTYTKLEINGTPKVPKGGTAIFSAIATRADGQTVDVTEVATWKSSDASVAVAGDTLGTFTVAGGGTTDITAGFEGLTATTQLTGIGLQRLQIDQPTDHLERGRSVAITVTGWADDGSTLDVTEHVQFTTGNTLVADVYGSRLRTKARGQTSLTASLGGLTASQSVRVVEVVSIEVEPTGVSANVGDAVQLMAYANFDDGVTEEVTNRVTWLSDNAVLAPVDANGLVTFKGDGVFNFTARRNRFGYSVEGTGTITVSGNAPTNTILGIYAAEQTRIVQYSHDAGGWQRLSDVVTAAIEGMDFLGGRIVGAPGFLASDVTIAALDPITGAPTGASSFTVPSASGSAVATIPSLDVGLVAWETNSSNPADGSGVYDFSGSGPPSRMASFLDSTFRSVFAVDAISPGELLAPGASGRAAGYTASGDGFFFLTERGIGAIEAMSVSPSGAVTQLAGSPLQTQTRFPGPIAVDHANGTQCVWVTGPDVVSGMIVESFTWSLTGGIASSGTPLVVPSATDIKVVAGHQLAIGTGRGAIELRDFDPATCSLATSGTDVSVGIPTITRVKLPRNGYSQSLDSFDGTTLVLLGLDPMDNQNSKAVVVTRQADGSWSPGSVLDLMGIVSDVIGVWGRP